MKIVGIVAEFNPMHNGHAYLIQKAKELTKADTAICIMSGNFTQAGNIAVQDKFKRANIAIQNGFDAVIELPTIYATSSAEFFSCGAINILNNLNSIDYLCFGSETGDTDNLMQISKVLIKNEQAIWDNISECLKTGISFAKAREYAISKFLNSEQVQIATMANNILAIEYIKTLLKLNSKIVPLAIKRDEKDNITSATKIRQMIAENLDNKELSKYILDANSILDNPQINENMYQMIKYAIISKGKEYLSSINEITEGLENKLCDEISNSNNYDEFVQNVKSKRYQLSKIKRILINILLDITKNDFDNLYNNAHYAHIIAINPNAKDNILSTLNKNSNIPIITSINDKVLTNLSIANRKSLELDIKSSNVYSVFSNDKINKDFTNKI